MAIQFYTSKGHYRPTGTSGNKELSHLPGHIALELGEVGITFYEMLKNMRFMLNNTNVIMHEIISSISLRYTAELELSYMLLSVAKDDCTHFNHEDIPLINQKTNFINMSNAFGLLLMETLDRLGAYENGCLQYKYEEWRGSILVLKLDVIV